MHLLTLAEPVYLNKVLGTLPAGDWLVHDVYAFEVAQHAPRGTARVKDHGWNAWLSQEEDAPTLIFWSGQIGDLLMLTPLLGKPGTALCCLPHHHELFAAGWKKPLVLESYPLPLARVNLYKEIISLENTMEADNTVHATDAYAKALGVPTPLKNYIPTYLVTDEEKEATKKWLFTNRPNVALHMRASVANRTYPFPLWLNVIKKLEERGWGVLLLGKKGQIPPLDAKNNSPYIRNLAEADLPIRESVAVLAQCDAFCGVDSAFMHFAGALGIPSVSLHGPIPWQTRSKHYKENTAITGTGECAGCCWHLHAQREFPPNKPCSQVGQCVVLASIPTERIVAKIDALKPK